MKTELIRKCVRINHSDCDNQLKITDPINRVEPVLFKEFNLLEDEVFHDLGLEVLLNGLASDEGKAVLQICSFSLRQKWCNSRIEALEFVCLEKDSIQIVSNHSDVREFLK